MRVPVFCAVPSLDTVVGVTGFAGAGAGAGAGFSVTDLVAAVFVADGFAAASDGFVAAFGDVAGFAADERNVPLAAGDGRAGAAPKDVRGSAVFAAVDAG